jgi:mono/diheme cytochrome c family protein
LPSSGASGGPAERIERIGVTEIPEHLLKRSKERKAAADGAAASSDATPAVVASAAPAARAAAPAPVVKVAPPKPELPALRAAKARKRIPIWAMPVVAGLPIWGLMYFLAIKAPKVRATGPLAEGAQVYSACASCHGTEGGGGYGYPFVNNSLWQTFPTIEEQIRYVYNGTKGVKGLPYGSPDRPGGPHVGGVRGNMPNWGIKTTGGTLTDAQMVAVICHERHGLAAPTIPALKPSADKELALWCSPDGKKWLEVEEKGFDKMGINTTAANA